MAEMEQTNVFPRPVYPDGDEQAMVYRSAEDGADYPDQVYAHQDEDEEFEDEANAMPWAMGGEPRKSRQTALWAFIFFICLALLCLMGYFVASLYQAYRPFRQKAAIVAQSTIAQGVLVDGVHVGGMTREAAAEALKRSNEQGHSLSLTVHVDDQIWIITENELPLERNTQAVLDTAYAVGRQGSVDTIAGNSTPFEYRYAHLYHTVTTPVNLYTTVTYDPDKLWDLVRFIENRINREAVDAQVATFDFSTRSFTFTQDAQGVHLDADALYQDLQRALSNAETYHGGEIWAETEPVMPKVTKVELMNTFSLISSYTTQTTSDQNRNNNINLACRAVNGTVVMPGETFSFNQTTGQRTEEKGYLPAAAIAGGATVDEIGGGVCQVSSTIFNAAAMADMTIVSRSPHSWPSNYVDKGRDATVNWPNLDFSFRNDSAFPVFIVSYYQQRKCTVELYGASLGPGRTIDLATRLISTSNPPAEPVYEYNPLLPFGAVQEKKKARIGYVVETYKVYRQNGAETKRELLCTSDYPMIQQVLEYNQ